MISVYGTFYSFVNTCFYDINFICYIYFYIIQSVIETIQYIGRKGKYEEIFTVLCMVLLVVGLTACRNPSLEEVVEDPEFMEQFDSAMPSFESQGIKVHISAKGDVFRYDCSSDQLTQSHAEML